MKDSPTFFLGVRNLFVQRGNSLRLHVISAILGVGLSVVPLVVVMEITGGMIAGITQRYIEIGTYHFQVKTYRGPQEIEVDEITKKINKAPQVVDAFPVCDGLGLLSVPGKGRLGISLRGLPEDIMARDLRFAHYLDSRGGEFSLEKGEIVIGPGIADKLDIHVGDDITVITGKTLKSGKILLRPNAFRVSGIFSSGYQELDSLRCYINYESASSLLGESAQIFIGGKVDNPYRGLEKILLHLQDQLPLGWYTASWYELEEGMYRSLRTTEFLLLLIMGLIVCVAAINVSSTLIMLVLEKKNEIAILRAMGAKKGLIRGSFLLTGMIIGISGAALGIPLGILLSLQVNSILQGIEWVLNEGYSTLLMLLPGTDKINISEITIFNSSYYLETIPIDLEFGNLFLIALFTITVAAIASYLPARKAGNTLPMEQIRKKT